MSSGRKKSVSDQTHLFRRDPSTPPVCADFHQVKVVFTIVKYFFLGLSFKTQIVTWPVKNVYGIGASHDQHSEIVITMILH